MIYSPGMPILYMIATLQTFVLYWVDKILCKFFGIMYIVLRLYMKPPKYGNEMAEVSRNAMAYAIFFHFIFGFLMYSNSNIFAYSNIISWLTKE